MTQELRPPEPEPRLFLLDCPIAGIAYHQARECIGHLEESTPLTLLREPDNPHDALAIAIHWQPICMKGFKLGYVPRIHNPILARLMDAGKRLTAEVNLIHATDAVNQEHSSKDLRISIFFESNEI